MKLVVRKQSGSIVAAAAALLFVGLIAFVVLTSREAAAPEEPQATAAPEAHIITESALESIIKTSKLTTFSAAYNGIAAVPGKDNPEEIAYYVAYEAEVRAGINMDDLDIRVDQEAYHIEIELPDILLEEPDVEITSLDYIFMDDDANTSTVTEEAYRASKEDAKEECTDEEEITARAKENAVRALRALVEPLVEQNDPVYTLEIL